MDLIYEDRQSVAFPESHALALIPYCLENPHLRIERLLNVWRNVLPSGYDLLLWMAARPEIINMPAHIDCINSESARIGTTFAVWILEAMRLADQGMPLNSFKLVFDGYPAPEQSSQIFDLLKNTAANANCFGAMVLSQAIPKLYDAFEES